MPKTLGDARHVALIKIIKQKRKDAGLKQTELAKRMNVYQSFIARLESGQRRIDVIELIKIAEVLEFDAALVVHELKAIKK